MRRSHGSRRGGNPAPPAGGRHDPLWVGQTYERRADPVRPLGGNRAMHWSWSLATAIGITAAVCVLCRIFDIVHSVRAARGDSRSPDAEGTEAPKVGIEIPS